jgi:hypothetical protein
MNLYLASKGRDRFLLSPSLRDELKNNFELIIYTLEQKINTSVKDNYRFLLKIVL